ncbi:FKBP-type peptidyl-prolyl cis-trans isomerase [Mucilaginibacter arboris]|uniref:peptidylprolyl isomerase n=1 Tax=Mucilaginibacter arboris TaxID=2682090 RepID=A0A7K1SW79_9SPHI|nr:FKBP-type peptidyl-prolyl cis-trans isomerase [Mucilaginibacter arboris]MVN21497.1 FKBP-type peptidylprolyl isomerase [Mucilaginibacter arboris]
MKKNLVFLTVAALAFAGCNGFKKGDNGLEYKIYTDAPGATIKTGDFVSVNVIAKTDKDSVLFNSYDMGRPSQLLVAKPMYKGDLYTGLMMLSEGDSATLKIDADTLVKRSGQPKPPGFKGKYFVYTLKIEKVLAKGNMPDKAFQEKISQFFKAEADKSRAAEPIKIKKYITDKNLKVITTPSGLNYVITQPGTGEKIAVGDTAVVDYTGKLMNSKEKVFDTSVKEVAQKAGAPLYDKMRPYQPIKIEVGKKAVIPGWDEGLQLLSKGEKATFIIPSSLAYGEQGYGPIAPFSPLVFDVELKNIIHPDPNAPKKVLPQMPQMPQQAPANPAARK